MTLVRWGISWGSRREGVLRVIPWRYRSVYRWRFRSVSDAWYFRAWAVELRVMR